MVLSDCAWPGLLGDLKGFNNKYGNNTEEDDLIKLSKTLTNPLNNNQLPSFIKRRLKENILEGLPRKYKCY